MAARQVLFCLGLYILVASGRTISGGSAHGSCHNDDIPMCARSRDNGMYFLFSNECELRKAQRGNLIGAPLYDVALRHCFPNCDFQCVNQYEPVCGASASTGERRTFRSRCEMARTSCLSQSDWAVYGWGVCPKASRQQTPTQHTSPYVGKNKRPQPVPCTGIYRPVCAAYAGVKSTFSNECLVNAENIETQRNWRIVSEGLCGEDSTKMKHSRKYKPRAKPKLDADRTKRSPNNNNSNQVEDFQIPEDAVEIYAPSTFHTQFISNTGTMEKSYSLPARRPYVVAAPKLRRVYGSATNKGSRKPCVFSNEPVCGSFNGQRRTFPNVCVLMEHSQSIGNAWTILHDGPCRHCDKPCPSLFQPVCASRNGVRHTVINECYLERVRCKDPSIVWKIVHKGECVKAKGTIKPKVTTTERGQKSVLIPRMLYASRLSTTTGKPLPNAPTTKAPANPYKPRQQFKKSFRPTPASQEFNNRKIRKIELASAPILGPVAGSSEEESASGYWSSNDNWLVRKTLDNVKGYFSKKPSTFKKAHSAKYPQHYWVRPVHSTPQPDPLEATTSSSTTTVSPMPPMLSIASTELLNLDLGNAANLYEDVDPQMLLTSTTLTPEPIETTTAPPRTTQTSASVATNPPATTDPPPATMSTSAEAWEETTASMEETSATTAASIDSVSTEAATSSATVAEDLSSTEAESSESTATEASGELSTTTPSSDYTAEEPLAESSGQTSIYGLDKNSLIMRLLRARTNKNVFI